MTQYTDGQLNKIMFEDVRQLIDEYQNNMQTGGAIKLAKKLYESLKKWESLASK